MGQVIPKQHPEVVLRSHYKAVRALLAVTLVAIVALAATLVIVADDNDAASSAQPKVHQQQQTLPPGTRFDGGPDEGTRGPQSYWEQSDPRTSYQPAPADGFKARSGGPRMIPQGPGAR
jgi:hypothetical protein